MTSPGLLWYALPYGLLSVVLILVHSFLYLEVRLDWELTGYLPSVILLLVPYAPLALLMRRADKRMTLLRRALLLLSVPLVQLVVLSMPVAGVLQDSGRVPLAVLGLLLGGAAAVALVVSRKDGDPAIVSLAAIGTVFGASYWAVRLAEGGHEAVWQAVLGLYRYNESIPGLISGVAPAYLALSLLWTFMLQTRTKPAQGQDAGAKGNAAE